MHNFLRSIPLILFSAIYTLNPQMVYSETRQIVLDDELKKIVGTVKMGNSNCPGSKWIRIGKKRFGYDCWLEFESIRAVQVEALTSEVNFDAVPERIVVETRPYDNCDSDSPIQINDTIVLVTQEGVNVTRSHTVSTANSSNLSTTIQLPGKLINAGFSGSVNFSSTVTDLQSEVKNKLDTRTESKSISFQLAPGKTHVVSFSKILRSGFVDLTGKVILDARVVAVGRTHDGNHRRPLKMLSEYVASESDRTIDLNARLWIVQGLEASRKDAEYDCDDQDIASQQATAEEIEAYFDNSDSAIFSTDMPTEMVEAMSSYEDFQTKLTGIALQSSGGEVLISTPIVSGMTIKTADVVANVNVRAQSLGPGYCATQISSANNGVTQILAPPLTWSSWQPLFFHVGSVTDTISTNTICDTGALFEIEYYQ